MKEQIKAIVTGMMLVAALSLGFMSGQHQASEHFNNESCFLTLCNSGDISICQYYRLHPDFCEAMNNTCGVECGWSDKMADDGFTCHPYRKILEGREELGEVSICQCRMSEHETPENALLQFTGGL